MIVLDASAAIELLLRSPLAAKIEERILDQSSDVHAPHLLDVEVTQVLRRYMLQRVLSPQRAEQALEDLSDLPISRYPHNLFLPRLWALRNNLSAYDAAYVALAEALDATLLTCDRRIKKAPGHVARVELLGEG